MEAILIALGGIFGVFLFVVLVLVAAGMILVRIYWRKVTRFFTNQAQAFNEASDQAAKFARDSILLVLETWQVEDFSQRSTPQLLETVPGGDLAALLLHWKKTLGTLVSCEQLGVVEGFSGGQLPSAEGQKVWDFTSLATATYSAVFQCQRGAGQVVIQVIKRESLWFVNRFHLESDQGDLTLGESTTLEALRERIQQEQQLNNTIDVRAIEP